VSPSVPSWAAARARARADGREYIAPMEFDANDKPTKMAGGKRSFCGDCSSMLWNYDEEWAKVSAGSTAMSESLLSRADPVVDLPLCVQHRQAGPAATYP